MRVMIIKDGFALNPFTKFTRDPGRKQNPPAWLLKEGNMQCVLEKMDKWEKASAAKQFGWIQHKAMELTGILNLADRFHNIRVLPGVTTHTKSSPSGWENKPQHAERYIHWTKNEEKSRWKKILVMNGMYEKILVELQDWLPDAG